MKLHIKEGIKIASDIYNTGSTNVNNAATSGNNAISSFDPNAWAKDTQGGLTSLWNVQGTTQNDYLKAYKDAISANPSVTSLYDTANEKFNVPTLQKNATTLGNAMLTAPNSNIDAAKGFNYDQNQIDQKTSQDLQRLGPSATAAANAATTAEGLAGNYVTAGISQNNFNLLPVQEQGQYLMDSYARQQSGFTSTAQAQLQSLQAKMQAGEQLSAAEMSAYATLTSAEASYQGSLAQAGATVNAAKINNQFKNPQSGSTLVNTTNGAWQTY